jgi:hypothetical protein
MKYSRNQIERAKLAVKEAYDSLTSNSNEDLDAVGLFDNIKAELVMQHDAFDDALELMDQKEINDGQ